jgi:hypothetical protein
MPPDDAASTPRSMPTDTPLLQVLANLEAEGYEGQFQAVEGARLRCLTCRRDFPAHDVDADEATRLEGVSDPADMLIVIPTTCPHCDTRGPVVLRYGPDSSIEEAEALLAVERRPREGTGEDGDISTPGLGT